VTRDEFMANAKRGGFLEWAEYLDDLYGTPNPEADRDTILVIEVQGAAQVLEKRPDAHMILVVPPSREALATRMRGRGDPPDRIERRLAAADAEVARGRELAHDIVVNEDADRAALEVAGILASYRET
jgi:guanylate kinase